MVATDEMRKIETLDDLRSLYIGANVLILTSPEGCDDDTGRAIFTQVMRKTDDLVTLLYLGHAKGRFKPEDNPLIWIVMFPD